MPPRSPLAPRVRHKPAGKYHHGELRRALLDATLSIVASDGTTELSLRAVARRVGVSPQATYNHFRDRAALLCAAAEEGLKELARNLREARDGVHGPEERLLAIGIAYVTFASSHAAHFRLLSAPDLAAQLEDPGVSSAYQEAFGVVLSAVKDCPRGRPSTVSRGSRSLGSFPWRACLAAPRRSRGLRCACCGPVSVRGGASPSRHSEQSVDVVNL